MISDFSENHQERTAGLKNFLAPIPPFIQAPQKTDPFTAVVQGVENQSPIGKFAAMNMEAQDPGSFTQMQMAQPSMPMPPAPTSGLAKFASAFIPGLGGHLASSRKEAEGKYDSAITDYAMSLPQDKAMEYLARVKSDKYLPMLMDQRDPMRKMQMEMTGMNLSDAKQSRAGRNSALSKLPGIMGLDPLTQSQITQESGGDPMAVSSAGAAGIMQIMPDTARDPGYGVQPLQGWDGKDPRTAPVEEQIRFGIDYRNAMIKEFGSVEKGLQAYNAGPGKLEDVQAGRAAMPAETAAYAPAIMNRMGAQPAQSAQPQSAIQRAALTRQQEFDLALAQGGDQAAITRLSASLAQEEKAPVTTGLPTGQMWKDGAAVPIPGVQQPKGDFKEFQLKPAGFASRMVNTENMIANLPVSAQNANRGVIGRVAGFLGAIPSGGLGREAGDALVASSASPEEQQYLNASKEWIRAKLRKESGAVIGADEMKSEYETYFPLPTDSMEVITQKELLRKQATDAMIKESNGAYEDLFPDLKFDKAPAKRAGSAINSAILQAAANNLSTPEQKRMAELLKKAGK